MAVGKSRYPAEFPREAFVQASIERHFLDLGFTLREVGFADFACEKPGSSENWVIEAKGETAAVGLDFRTGIGQLVLHITDRTTRYGLAVPDTEKFIKQCDKLPSRVRESLNIFILLVNSSGQVQIVAPNENVPS